jgi:hypothetical protein
MLIKLVHNLKWQFILVCFFSLLVTFYCQKSAILNKYTFNEDLRGNIFWMERARNVDMFSNDLIADLSVFFANPLLMWFYKIMSFINVQLLANLLAFPLCLISAIYMYKLGNKIGGVNCAFFSGIIFVLSAWYRSNFDFFGIGNAGDFFPLLGAVFLYYFFVDNTVAMALILILQAFLYPPIFLISFVCFMISVLSKINFRKAIIFFLVVFISFLVLSNNSQKSQMQYFGGTYTIKEIRNMDEFKEDGRIPLIYTSLFKRIFNNRSGMGELNGRLGILLSLALICAAFYIKRIRDLVPLRVSIFLLVSIIFFILANIFMLSLFEPSRYLLVSLPVFLIIVVSICLAGYVNLSTTQKARGSICILLFLLLSILFSGKIKPAYTTIEDVKLFNFLERIPKNSLIAGHPFVLDNIPLITKKRVFLTSEASLPYFKKYYTVVQKRTYGFFKAYYSTSLDLVINFCRKNNINYLIVRKDDFSKKYLEERNFYYEPFNNFIARLTEGRNEYALTSIPKDIVKYEDSDYIVMGI